MRILLVDDEPFMGPMLEQIAGRTIEHAVVVQVVGCDAALDQLKRNPFDVVLMDYRLVGSDGLACLRKIRATMEDLPVVMVTGSSDPELIRASLDAGADDYLFKPNLVQMLHHVLRSAIERRQGMRHYQKEAVKTQDTLERLRQNIR